jgi:exopolyphosphatase/guanosine-5'-triphosphate,3'-diphosphate pyrophosphatase
MEQIITQSLELARRCKWEEGHSRQVTKLSLQLFDQLKPLHNLGDEERISLEAGAILHDIGFSQNEKSHHKLSRDIIVDAKELAIGPIPRAIIALIARYHRKSLPKKSHKYYCDLDVKNKDIVNKLSAILRIADGLDRTHRGMVKDVECDIKPEQVIIRVDAQSESPEDREAAQNKADLFEKISNRKVIIENL